VSAPRGACALFLSDGTCAVTFAYDKWVIEELKRQIPADHRSYDPANKTWYVRPGWGQVAISVLRMAFDAVEVTTQDKRSQPKPIRRSDPNFSELHLLPSAPTCVIEAAYKAMAKANHPDRGGSTAAMQAINSAYAAIRPQKHGAA